MKKAFLWMFVLSLYLSACNLEKSCTTLPVLGEKDISGQDTVFHTIPDFKFISQDSQWVTPGTFEGKIYVADFFFISCPTICPKVKKEMLRVYQRFVDEPRVILLSHSIDVRHDTVPRLKAYANGLGVDSEKWYFVTGEEDEIFDIADDYFSVAINDPEAPGGFDHSGRLILVDTKGRVRSFCEGTDPASVDQFMVDIECLLGETQ